MGCRSARATRRPSPSDSDNKIENATNANKMSKKSQKALGQKQPQQPQQQQQQTVTNQNLQQSASGDQTQRSSATVATGTNENQDDQRKRTMTSEQQQQQQRKRARLSPQQLAGGETATISQQTVEQGKLNKSQQEMIDVAANGDAARHQHASLPDLNHHNQEQPPLPPQSRLQATSKQRTKNELATSTTTGPTRRAAAATAAAGGCGGVSLSPKPTSQTMGPPNATTAAAQNICAACLRPIKERYLLMALDKHWHEDCLKCACCDCRLGEVGSSLFTHSDKILCRRDFLRIFGQHGNCAACKRSIPPYEMVMRANELAYHMDCFACQQCQYRFCVGDRFHLTETHKIICLLCHSDQQQHQFQQQSGQSSVASGVGTTDTCSVNSSLACLDKIRELNDVLDVAQVHKSDSNLNERRLEQDRNKVEGVDETNCDENEHEDDDDDDEDDDEDDEVTSSATANAATDSVCPLTPAHQANKQKQACAV